MKGIKGVKVLNKPEWIKKLQRNMKARKRYFMNRYGSLDRMYAIDAKLQELMDEYSSNDEMEACED